jgi:outer membrane protein assembly factor BamA
MKVSTVYNSKKPGTLVVMLCSILIVNCFICSNAFCEDNRGGVSDTLITRIDVRGARIFSAEEVSRAIGITSGMKLSEESLNSSCSRLLKLCGDAGYPWAEVLVYVRADSTTDGHEVLFSLEEGRRARISEVQFSGNDITRTEVISRQIGIKSGEQFSLSRLDEGRKRLESWDMYTEVMQPKVYEDNNPYRVSILVPVKESKPNMLSGMLGFGSGKDGTRRLWGNVNFLMKNIMGTARRFEMKWSQASVEEKSLAVSYREPWIAGTPLSGDFSFSQRLRESVFMQMELGAGVSAVISDIGRAGLGFSHERLYPHGSGPDSYGTNEKNSVTGMLSWKGGTSISGPPGIEEFDIRASYGLRKEGTEGWRETLIQSGFDARVWGRGSIQVRVMGGLRAAFTSADEYPAYLTVPFGGSRTVRGHRDGELYVLRAFWTQNELRFSRGFNGDLHLFFDHAVSSFPVDDSTLDSSYLSGYGGGIRAQTSAGLLELDLAFSPGKGFGEARLHVGLKEEF